MAQWSISSSLPFGEVRAAAQGNCCFHSCRNRGRTKVHAFTPPAKLELARSKAFPKNPPTLTEITVLHLKMRSKRKWTSCHDSIFKVVNSLKIQFQSFYSFSFFSFLFFSSRWNEYFGMPNLLITAEVDWVSFCFSWATFQLQEVCSVIVKKTTKKQTNKKITVFERSP